MGRESGKVGGTNLRRRAEDALAGRPRRDPATEADASRLLHELQVHQVELEMQNDSLRQAQVALEEARDAYADLYDFAPVAYLTLAPDGLIAKVNLTGAALLGDVPGKLVGKQFALFVAPEHRDRWQRHWLRTIGDRAVGVAELTMRCGDGTIVRNVQIGCAYHETPPGNPDAGSAKMPFEVRVVLTDTTLRKAVEDELDRARIAADQASRAKSSFVSNISHEMRTPLHVIIGFAHLLRRDLTDPAQLMRMDQLCATSEHLLDIVTNILDLAKIESGRLVIDQTDFRLDGVVDKVVRMAEVPAAEKGLALTAVVDPRLADVMLNGDALRLTQVLINLLSNAIKFTDKGRVQLSIRSIAEEDANITVRFAVEDSGIGIRLADQTRIFRSFEQADASTTRERGGTGLGLAISQHLVALMGGSIHIDSQLGAGSTFSFDLVLPRAKGGPAGATAAAAATDLQGLRVLCAEDHPLSRELLFTMLDDLGCKVDLASDGVEAVACAAQRPYDLILMDMQMPRMDGLAASRAIRALPGHQTTPMIALTSNAFAEERQRCVDAGMNGHIGKPATPATIVDALTQWLPGYTAAARQIPVDCNELTAALEAIPGLKVDAGWIRSPKRLANHCARLDRFATTQRTALKQLIELMAAGDRDAAQGLAHDLKGIAGLLGADGIASLAGSIEAGLRNQADQAAIEALIGACDAELAALADAVRKLPRTSA